MPQIINRKRKASYPSATLKQALELTQKIIQSGLGKGPYTRQIITHTLGYSEASGLIAAKMAACVHFGIMTNSGSGYCLSTLGESLTNPRSEERAYDLCKSVSTPVLYAKLIDDYDGRTLPSDLEDLLVEHYGVNATVAPKVARVFRASLKYAGAIKRGKICCSSNRKIESQTSSVPAQNSSADPSRHDSKPQQPITEDDLICVVLPETGITMTFPKEYAYDLSIGTFSNEITALRDKAINRRKGGNM